VEYLHRTVKDYLERDDIWEGILDATSGASFSPNISLCRSFIVQLKILDPENLYGQSFWDLVTWCIQCAAVAERDLGSPQVQLLEGRLYAASQIVLKPKGNGMTFVQPFWGTPSSAGYHWTST